MHKAYEDPESTNSGPAKGALADISHPVYFLTRRRCLNTVKRTHYEETFSIETGHPTPLWKVRIATIHSDALFSCYDLCRDVDAIFQGLCTCSRDRQKFFWLRPVSQCRRRCMCVHCTHPFLDLVSDFTVQVGHRYTYWLHTGVSSRYDHIRSDLSGPCAK